ncbi:hypothetical protein [Maioricimonas sp. JC845]|uniref:hypothetical protein n=1 Tax=Maioricimonas sp. JC845 TaxID=3232138 RepID=UPI00345A927C
MDVVSRLRSAAFPNEPFGLITCADEQEQWEEIRFLFGKAMLWAQAFEDSLLEFVITAERIWKRSRHSESQLRRLTLGKLLQEARLYCTLSESHTDEMRQALAARNAVAHGFFSKRRALLARTSGRANVIDELNSAIDQFQVCRDEVNWWLFMLAHAGGE